MRICIVAEHASFQFGGEAVLPLHYFSGLRGRNVEAWLVVHSRTRSEIESLYPEDLDRLHFVRDTWFHKLIVPLSRLLPRRVSSATFGLASQLLTQYLQRRVVRKLVATKSIDIVHQPIPVSPRFPSLMSNLGAPVVIGPMNGGMENPKAFRHAESFLSRASIGLGRSFSNIVNLWLPGKKLARILLVANERTRMALPRCVQGKVIELPENGVDLRIWSPPSDAATADPGESTRFVFIGRLVDWKGVDMAIEALSHVPDATLEIIGDGPMLGEWKQLAEKLGIAKQVSFSGWLAQHESAVRLQSAVALVLPSIYECGGAVVLEAMATGLPVIATRWGGPVDYLNDSCGVLIEPSSREAIVQGFAEAMRRMLASPAWRKELGVQGRQRTEQHFDWRKKIDRILEIYEQAIHPE